MGARKTQLSCCTTSRPGLTDAGKRRKQLSGSDMATPMALQHSTLQLSKIKAVNSVLQSWQWLWQRRWLSLKP